MMRDGKLLQYETPDEIYSRPKNKFVGWFLGNPGMNFIECVTKRKNDTLVLDAGSFVALDRIPSQYNGKVTAEQPVTLGVRPENIAFSSGKKDGHIPCVCRFAEPVASRLLLNVELGKDVKINVKVPMTHEIQVGDQIYIRFPEEKVMLFDEKTGDVL
jgi:ABC-type sugar transport system ATPase subunit